MARTRCFKRHCQELQPKKGFRAFCSLSPTLESPVTSLTPRQISEVSMLLQWIERLIRKALSS